MKFIKSRILKKFTLWVFGFFIVFTLSVLGYLKYLIHQVENEKYGTFHDFDKLFIQGEPKASFVYTADSVELGRFFTENRINVKYEDLSPELVKTLIAVEDPRYNKYNAFDFWGFIKINMASLFNTTTEFDAGMAWNMGNASYLFYEKNSKSTGIILRHLEQFVISKKLLEHFGKKQLLANYLNMKEFLYNSHGIHAAAKTYFNKTPKELGWNESAVLVGMLKAPYLFNPRINPENAAQRKLVVLNMLKNRGDITDYQFDSLSVLPIELEFAIREKEKPFAGHFRNQVRLLATKWCDENGYNLYKDGITIYTTLDSRIQRYAEKAAREHMAYIQKNFNEHWANRDKPWLEDENINAQIKYSSRFNMLHKRLSRKKGATPSFESVIEMFEKIEPRKMKVLGAYGEVDTTLSPLDSFKHYLAKQHSSVLVMNSKAGDIKAWVGDINHEHFPYDQVLAQGKQMGTSIKPLNYLSAIEGGHSPCLDIEGLIYMPLIQFMSIRPSIAVEPKKYADSTLVYKYMIDLKLIDSSEQKIASQSIHYGLNEGSLYNFTKATNTFNNGGKMVTPSIISSIFLGDSLLYYNQDESTFVFNQEQAQNVHAYLKNVVNRGTGMRLRSSSFYSIRTPIAGFQGSTQNGNDNWYFGFTPDLTIGIWAGSNNRKVAFRDMRFGSGARMCMPIFGELIISINADSTIEKSEDWFEYNNMTIHCE
ncbi:MAG: transglycosylase domain-containing protein [Bacteroidia bacterium]